jgi:beta-galactosidase/beta-glucuronidase
MDHSIEIFVGDVNDVEARVYARYVGAAENEGAHAERIVLKGRLRGPYCERSRTLPAEIAFRDSEKPGLIEALVPDPCTWSPDLPHLYQADVEARQGQRVLAEYHGTIGLRRGQHD